MKISIIWGLVSGYFGMVLVYFGLTLVYCGLTLACGLVCFPRRGRDGGDGSVEDPADLSRNALPHGLAEACGEQEGQFSMGEP